MGQRLGLAGRRGRLERGPARCRRSTPGCRTSGSRSSAASSGRATTRTTRASCSSTAGSGRTRCRATACRSSPVEHDPPVDRLDDEFPIRLTTGRRLDSYNTGVQTGGYTSPLRRGESLDISPEDAAAARPRRRRARPRHVPPRPGRDADPDRRVAAARAHVHDAPLPGRRRDEPAHDRRDGPEVRHGRVQGDGDPDREAASTEAAAGVGAAT